MTISKDCEASSTSPQVFVENRCNIIDTDEGRLNFTHFILTHQTQICLQISSCPQLKIRGQANVTISVNNLYLHYNLLSNTSVVSAPGKDVKEAKYRGAEVREY